MGDRFRPLFFILSGAYLVQMFSANSSVIGSASTSGSSVSADVQLVAMGSHVRPFPVFHREKPHPMTSKKRAARCLHGNFDLLKPKHVQPGSLKLTS